MTGTVFISATTGSFRYSSPGSVGVLEELGGKQIQLQPGESVIITNGEEKVKPEPERYRDKEILKL
jgi:hypothetical protein